jgi:hypothetical protein
VVRAFVFTAAPILGAMGLHDSLTPKFELPIELPTLNPAPPATIRVDGRRFALQEERNPFRVDDIGRYSDTVQRQYLDADPWNATTVQYLRYVREGGVIYFQHCHFCHGAALDARGIYAYAVRPWPVNFSDAGTIAQFQEVYIFWKTSVGGIGMPREAFPWASAMPGYQDTLRTEDIWKVILFLYWFTAYEPRVWH